MNTTYEPNAFIEKQDDRNYDSASVNKETLLNYPIFLLNEMSMEFWKSIPISWVKDITEQKMIFIQKAYRKKCLEILHERLQTEEWWLEITNDESSGLSISIEEAAKDVALFLIWIKKYVFQNEDDLKYWIALDFESFVSLSRGDLSHLNIHQLYFVKYRFVELSQDLKTTSEYKNTMKKIDYLISLRKKQGLPILWKNNQQYISIHKLFKLLKYDLPPTKKIQSDIKNLLVRRSDKLTTTQDYNVLLPQMAEDQFIDLQFALKRLREWYYPGELKKDNWSKLTINQFLDEKNLLTPHQMIDLLGFKGTISRMSLNEKIGFLKIGEIDEKQGSFKSKKTLFLRSDVINYALNNAIHLSATICEDLDFRTLIISKAHRRLKLNDGLNYEERLNVNHFRLEEEHSEKIKDLYEAIMFLSLLLVWYRFTEEDKKTFNKLHVYIENVIDSLDQDDRSPVNIDLLRAELKALATFLYKDLSSAQKLSEGEDENKSLNEIFKDLDDKTSGHFMNDNHIKEVSLKHYFHYSIYKRKKTVINEFLRVGEILARKALNVPKRNYKFYANILNRKQKEEKC